jgi:maltooligosyltrehalose trehalohydrolase
MVFMGEEWAASTPWQFFSDFDDPQLAAAVSAGRRAEFAEHGWAAADVPDPQSPATRDVSVLRWDERGQGDHGRVLAWYRSLIDLRRRVPALRTGRLDEVAVRWDDEARWLVVARDDWRVACNLAPAGQQVPLDVAPAQVALSWSGAAVLGSAPSGPVPSAEVALEGHDVAVLRRR